MRFSICSTSRRFREEQKNTHDKIKQQHNKTWGENKQTINNTTKNIQENKQKKNKQRKHTTIKNKITI